jgi:FkbM family methyltransferase
VGKKILAWKSRFFQFNRGFFEKILENFYSNYLTEGDLAVDCGANIGKHTLKMAQRVGADGLVWAFEPQPDMCEHIRKRGATANLFERVRLECVALGAEEGKARFRRVIAKPALSHLEVIPRQVAEYEVEIIEVPVRRIVRSNFRALRIS